MAWFRDIKMDYKQSIKKILCGILVIAMFGVFALGALNTTSDCAEAVSMCCDPTIFKMDVAVWKKMLLEMVQNTLVSKMQGILADKLGLQFLQGSFFGDFAKGLMNGDISLSDFSADAESFINDAVNTQIEQVQSLVSPENLSNTIVSATENVATGALNNILSEQGITNIVDVKNFGQQYTGFLDQATGLIRGDAQQYLDSVTGQLKDVVAPANISIANLGAASDLSASILEGAGVSVNLKGNISEAMQINIDASKMADISFGTEIKKTMSESFTKVNEEFLNTTSSLIGKSFCDKSNSERCYTITEQDVKKIIGTANNTAVTTATNSLNSVQTSITNNVNQTYSKMATTLTNQVSQRVQLFNQAEAKDKQVVNNAYFDINDKYNALESKIANGL